MINLTEAPPRQPTTEYNTRIREMPTSDRPRERLRDHGGSALSNPELLAILLRTGTHDQSVLSLASHLLSKHHGLGGLARLSFADLKAERGLGEAKAAELVALFTLAQRINALTPDERPFVRSPADVMSLFGNEMSYLDQEVLRVLLVNTRSQMLGYADVYRGSVTTAQVRIGEIFREAIRRNAPSIVMVHNHPSGDPTPSSDDIHLTKLAAQAGDIMQVELLDHIIIGEKRFLSMKSVGMGFGA